MPTPAFLAGLAITVALCWALPLFGGTLAAFLLTDLYLGEVRRQRDAATQEAALNGTR